MVSSSNEHRQLCANRESLFLLVSPFQFVGKEHLEPVPLLWPAVPLVVGLVLTDMWAKSDRFVVAARLLSTHNLAAVLDCRCYCWKLWLSAQARLLHSDLPYRRLEHLWINMAICNFINGSVLILIRSTFVLPTSLFDLSFSKSGMPISGLESV